MTRGATTGASGRSAVQTGTPSRPRSARNRPRALARNSSVPSVAAPDPNGSSRLILHETSPLIGSRAATSPSRLVATIDPAHTTGSPARGALKPLQVQADWKTRDGGL